MAAGYGWPKRTRTVGNACRRLLVPADGIRNRDSSLSGQAALRCSATWYFAAATSGSASPGGRKPGKRSRFMMRDESHPASSTTTHAEGQVLPQCRLVVRDGTMMFGVDDSQVDRRSRVQPHAGEWV